jgi:23S rRNA pseudouridine1911/1915/1917 synthase
VHRLDRDTSGLLVVAKTEQAHQHLTEQFAARTVMKRYVALVYGKMKVDSGVIDQPIGRHTTHRTRMAVAPGRGRPAYTKYQRRAQASEFALLDVEIKTGRTHQIRVHLAHIHHPVVGDEVYAPNRGVNLQSAMARRAIVAMERHFLHAAHLAFTHPLTNLRMEFDSPLPAELTGLLTIIGVDSK